MRFPIALWLERRRDMWLARPSSERRRLSTLVLRLAAGDDDGRRCVGSGKVALLLSLDSLCRRGSCLMRSCGDESIMV